MLSWCGFIYIYCFYDVYLHVVYFLIAYILMLKTNVSIRYHWNTEHRSYSGPDSQRVTFSVTLTHNAVLGYHTPIEFDRILTNVGNAYDSSDGHFIAPIRGLYLMSVSIMNVEDHEEHTEIVRNGVQLVAMYSDDDDYSMASQTIVVLLETGDKVWVRRLFGGSATILGKPNEPYNTFSGVLLFEM